MKGNLLQAPTCIRASVLSQLLVLPAIYTLLHDDRSLTNQEGVHSSTMASFQVNPPEKFSFKPEEWPKYIRHFERVRLVSGLSIENEESQVDALI